MEINIRPAIIILGMHRSGTSTTSGVFNILGCDIGKSVLPGNFANPKGHFENRLIVEFNNKLLAKVGASWYNTISVKPHDLDVLLLTKEKNELLKIIDEEFSDSKFVLIKDPRIITLLPFYLDVFDEARINPHFIINFRDPVLSCNSLFKRDGINQARCMGLWIDHMLKAVNYTRKFPRVFLNYSSLLCDPVQSTKVILKQFDIKLDITQESTEKIKTFVDPSLNHSNRESFVKRDKLYVFAIKLYKHFCSLDLEKPAWFDSIRLKIAGRWFYRNFSGKNAPRVSVVSCIHENQGDLVKTMKSVLNQKYQNTGYYLLMDGKNDLDLDFFQKKKHMFQWIENNGRAFNSAVHQLFSIIPEGVLVFINPGEELVSQDSIDLLLRMIRNTEKGVCINFFAGSDKRIKIVNLKSKELSDFLK